MKLVGTLVTLICCVLNCGHYLLAVKEFHGHLWRMISLFFPNLHKRMSEKLLIYNELKTNPIGIAISALVRISCLPPLATPITHTRTHICICFKKLALNVIYFLSFFFLKT